MQVINNNELFTQVAAEESAIASGGAGAFIGSFAFAGFLTDGIFTPAEALATTAVALA